jgi:hypothetical protein
MEQSDTQSNFAKRVIVNPINKKHLPSTLFALRKKKKLARPISRGCWLLNFDAIKGLSKRFSETLSTTTLKTLDQ